jgi:lipopolysaccharide export system permease protein
MIVQRYLAKEVITTLAALTTILLLIFLSNQFVQYLSRSAGGTLPGMVVLKLMMLEIPNLTGLLLPLGLYMAILVAYGRLYAESEMIVLQACGYTQKQLIITTLGLSAVVAIITGVLMVWASPIIARDRQQLIKGGGVSALIQVITPQRFTALNQGKRVFYVSEMSRDHTQADGVFLAQQEENSSVWNIVWANKGFTEEDKKGAQFVVLENGQGYKGSPGEGDFQVVSYKKYKVRLPQSDTTSFKSDIRTTPTAELFPINNKDPLKAAEIQWRFSIPLMSLTLGLLAIPLSKVEPRRGKLAKMLPAIIIYVIYANMMFVGRDWIIAKEVPTWLGLWWIHGAVILLALILIIRTQKLR